MSPPQPASLALVAPARPAPAPRPAPALQAAVLERFRRRAQARGYKQKSVAAITALVENATQRLGRPFWEWTEEDTYLLADLFGALAITTQRKYQSALKIFFEDASSPELAALVQAETGVAPRQLWHAGNTIPHRVERDLAAPRRALTRQELAQLFGAGFDQPIAAAEAARSKSLRALERDKTLFFLLYVGGLRPGEALGLTLHDFAPSVERPEMGPFGSVQVFGKAPRRGSKKLRQVALLYPALKEMLEAYLEEVRPHLAAGAPSTTRLFLSERGGALALGTLDARFQDALLRAGLDGRGLTPHCLRHSYASHMVESGMPMTVVQAQLGHAYLATTQCYTHITADYSRKALARVYRQILNGGRHG